MEAPHLRIIDRPRWDAVKARQAEVTIDIGASAGNPLSGGCRPQFPLSGVLACGCCGGGYTIVAKDRYGCATRRGKGTCDNTHTIMRQHIEIRVLGSLRDRILTPELVKEFVQTFDAELADLLKRAGSDRLRVTRELEKVERKLIGVVRAIEDGAWNDTLRGRLNELEQTKARLTSRLKALDAPAPPVQCIQMPPTCIEIRWLTCRHRCMPRTSARRPRRSFGS